MALAGLINGKEINRYAINDTGGPNVWDLASDMSISFNQTLALGAIRPLEPYGIITFQMTGDLLSRTKLLEVDSGLIIASAATMVKTQLLETSGDIEFDMGADTQLVPAMTGEHIVTFGLDAQIDHLFFSHWVEGLRMTVPAEDHLITVWEDNRSVFVPPDPEPAPRIVSVPGDYRRILVPRDPDELVPQKSREMVA